MILTWFCILKLSYKFMVSVPVGVKQFDSDEVHLLHEFNHNENRIKFIEFLFLLSHFILLVR
jgi:hypothetical protein